MARCLVILSILSGISLLRGPYILSAEGHRHTDNIIYINRESDEQSVTEPAVLCKRFRSRQQFGGEVCAKDGNTYPNPMYISCLNRHRSKEDYIEVAHAGICRSEADEAPECDKNFLYRPVCGTDNQTYANVEALNCKNAMTPGYEVKLVRVGECQSLKCPCRVPDQANVCASNGITYRSLAEVRCLRRHNPGLKVLHSGGCTVREVRRAQGRRMACHLAGNRYEWNPVCGQNNLTYANPYLYICHHPESEGKCAARPGECGTLRQLACTRAESINHRILEASALVCGSNGVTYRSYEHLHCATTTDRHLEAVATGKCNRVYDPCLLTVKPLLGRGDPVCGSDDHTYVSVEALWCVKRLGKKGLKYKHDGPCL